MRYVIALAATLGLLLILSGVVTGCAVLDARRTRAQLSTERAEFKKTVSELGDRLERIQEQADRVAKAQNEALMAWNRRSFIAQTADQPTWPPPRGLRGVGGPGKRR